MGGEYVELMLPRATVLRLEQLRRKGEPLAQVVTRLAREAVEQCHSEH